MSAPRPSPDDLAALARKYATLARLRRERERDGKVAERGVLRALAREFPGSLRELDTVVLDEIDRREVALFDAARGGAIERWMPWMVAYHRTMRSALFVKARLTRAMERDLVHDLAVQAKVDVDFVLAVAAPPSGRLNRVVFERLAAEFGEAAETIWEALFPARARSRY